MASKQGEGGQQELWAGRNWLCLIREQRGGRSCLPSLCWSSSCPCSILDSSCCPKWDARNTISTSGSASLLVCSPCNAAHHQVMIPCGCCCLLSSDLSVLNRSQSCWILTFPEAVPLTWDLFVCAGMNPVVPAGIEAWDEPHGLG